MNETLQRAVIYAVTAWILVQAGIDWDTAYFWSMVVLIGAGQWISYNQGQEQGVAAALEMMALISDDELAEVIRLIRSAQQEEDDDQQ